MANNNQTTYDRTMDDTDRRNTRNWLPLLLAPLLFYVGWMANDAARANESQNNNQNCPAVTSQK